MVKPKPLWCMDCRWLVVKVAIDGASAYWCRANETRINGPVTWRPACEQYSHPGAGRT